MRPTHPCSLEFVVSEPFAEELALSLKCTLFDLGALRIGQAVYRRARKHVEMGEFQVLCVVHAHVTEGERTLHQRQSISQSFITSLETPLEEANVPSHQLALHTICTLVHLPSRY